MTWFRKTDQFVLSGRGVHGIEGFLVDKEVVKGGLHMRRKRERMDRSSHQEWGASYLRDSMAGTQSTAREHRLLFCLRATSTQNQGYRNTAWDTAASADPITEVAPK